MSPAVVVGDLARLVRSRVSLLRNGVVQALRPYRTALKHILPTGRGTGPVAVRSTALAAPMETPLRPMLMVLAAASMRLGVVGVSKSKTLEHKTWQHVTHKLWMALSIW